MLKHTKEVEDKLFLDVNKEYFINASSSDKDSIFNQINIQFIQCCSDKQLEKIIDIAKLMNVAKYLRKSKDDGYLYHIYIDEKDKIAMANHFPNVELLWVTFNSKESVEQAIKILGEETIRLALSTDW